jgi:hypothetical protein
VLKMHTTGVLKAKTCFSVVLHDLQ